MRTFEAICIRRPTKSHRRWPIVANSRFCRRPWTDDSSAASRRRAGWRGVAGVPVDCSGPAAERARAARQASPGGRRLEECGLRRGGGTVGAAAQRRNAWRCPPPSPPTEQGNRPRHSRAVRHRRRNLAASSVVEFWPMFATIARIRPTWGQLGLNSVGVRPTLANLHPTWAQVG